MREMTDFRALIQGDLPAAQAVLKEAFWRPGKNEAFNEWTLARRVISDEGYIPQLCMIAKEEDSVCGYILLSRASVAGRTGLSLGPLAVRSSYQRRGIGRALVRRALEKARAMGFEWVAVLGGDYYRQFGFEDSSDHGVILCAGHPENKYLKILFLNGQGLHSIQGELRYCAAFYDESGALL